MSSVDKAKFRRSKDWINFRKHLAQQQCNDPITTSRLTKTANCHHLDLDESHYDDLSDPSNFIVLNKQSHETVHFLYNAKGGWRNALEQLRIILEQMEKLNEKQ